MRGSVVFCSAEGCCVLRGLEKEIPLTFRNVVIVDAKR